MLGDFIFYATAVSFGVAAAAVLSVLISRRRAAAAKGVREFTVDLRRIEEYMLPRGSGVSFDDVVGRLRASGESFPFRVDF